MKGCPPQQGVGTLLPAPARPPCPAGASWLGQPCLLTGWVNNNFDVRRPPSSDVNYPVILIKRLAGWLTTWMFDQSGHKASHLVASRISSIGPHLVFWTGSFCLFLSKAASKDDSKKGPFDDFTLGGRYHMLLCILVVPRPRIPLRGMRCANIEHLTIFHWILNLWWLSCWHPPPTS